MDRGHILILAVAVIFAVLALLSVTGGIGIFNSGAHYDVNITEITQELTIDNSNWIYDAKNDIYYQLGIVYCTDPETTEYESLAIYVPGEYFNGEENSNGTYTCSMVDNKMGNYSASTAPIVMPINTPGYSAHPAPTSYNANDVKKYTDVGLIYVDAGCRGRDNGGNYSGGAPWGVADLKAAILYLKFNGETLPGDSNRIFSFGHSGGGAQSAILGTSGDSELYTPYLESIGAALVDRNGNKLSDGICGAMCWCPITSLDTADEAYEWTMGQYSSEGTRANGTWIHELSNDMAVQYANYINDLHLKSPDGQILTLEKSDNGIYTSGSYYDYMLSVVEDSLNNYLNDTSFSYDSSSAGEMAKNSTSSANSAADSGNSSAPNADLPSDEGSDNSSVPGGEVPSDEGSGNSSAPNADLLSDDGSGNSSVPGGEVPSDDGSGNSSVPGGEVPSDEGSGNSSAPNHNLPSGDSNGKASSSDSRSDSSSGTYQSPQDYIDSLNGDEEWIIYDNATNTVNITSLEAFIKHCKSPSKDVGAFDDLERSQAENSLFGNGEEDSLHFDSIMANTLKENANKYSNYSDYNSSYADEYANDLKKVDKLNKTIEYRSNMYNPMYYICDSYSGSTNSNPAKYWRINSGIEQGDISFTVETNLALALMQCGNVESVEFNAVWGQGHTQAERTGSPDTNFINWINKCLN